MKNKNVITLILIGIFMLSLFFYFFKCSKKETKIIFTEQGTTNLKQGLIKLKIWDNNTEDGDTVKVFIDNKLLRDTLALRYQAKELNLGKLNKGEHILGVVAISEGTTSPASASMSLGNEQENKDFEMNASIKKPASWKIIIK